MPSKVTVQPVEEPITLAEAKAWLRVTSTVEDTLITSLIEACRDIIEQRLEVKFVTQTIEQRLDVLPFHNRYITLDYNPVVSISSLQYVNSSGSTATFNSNNYELDNTSAQARLYLKENATWPTVGLTPNAITITYVAGYGGASNVPGRFKQILKHLVGWSYENRMNPVEERATYLDKLITRERIFSFE